MASPYRTLSVEKRRELVIHDLKTNSGSRAAYIMAMVKKGGGFRPATLKKWPVEQLAGEIVRRKMETFQDEIGYLQLLYVELEPQYQIDFLTAVGVPHENGVLSEDLDPPLATAEKVAEAAQVLCDKHGDTGTHYLQTIAMFNPEAWPGVGEWLEQRQSG